MQYKVLTQHHYLKCAAIINSIDSDALVKYSKPGNLILNNYYFDDMETLYNVFGAVDEFGVIHGCVFTQFSKDDRSWHITYVVKQPFATIDTIMNLLSATMQFAEQCNYHTCFVTYYDNQHKIWERLANRVSILSHYNISTEEIIPAHKRSPFTYYWTRFQQRTISDRTIIVRGYCLKEQHRVFGNNTIPLHYQFTITDQ